MLIPKERDVKYLSVQAQSDLWAAERVNNKRAVIHICESQTFLMFEGACDSDVIVFYVIV